MNVYYAPSWGRHYTAAPDGSTRWLTTAEEADLAGRATSQRGLFTPAAAAGGTFDTLIRPAGRRAAAAATMPRPAAPATAVAGRDDAVVGAPRRVEPVAASRRVEPVAASRRVEPVAASRRVEPVVATPRRVAAVAAVAVVAGTLGLVAGLVLGASRGATGPDEPGAGLPVAELPADR